MSVNYAIPTINSRLQVVANAIDAGAGNGVLRLLDPAGNILSSLALSKPCANIAGGVLSFNGLALVDPAAAAGGMASAARVEDSNGTFVITGLTVGTGAPADIQLSPTISIVAGQTIALTAANITGH